MDSAIARKTLQSSMQETGLSLKAEQVSGTVKFKMLDKMAGSNCAQLEAQIIVGNFTMKKLASDVVVDRGTLQGEFHGCFPLLESAQSFRDGENLHARMVATGPNGQRVEFTMDRQAENTWLASGDKP